jgi:malate/lactate dehydrogenase
MKWIQGTSENDFVCMGVITDGSCYSIPKDLCFSLPVKCSNFEFEIIKDLELNAETKKKIEITSHELLVEKHEYEELL